MVIGQVLRRSLIPWPFDFTNASFGWRTVAQAYRCLKREGICSGSPYSVPVARQQPAPSSNKSSQAQGGCFAPSVSLSASIYRGVNYVPWPGGLLRALRADLLTVGHRRRGLRAIMRGTGRPGDHAVELVF